MYIMTTDPIDFIPTKFKESELPLTFIVKPPTRLTSLRLQDIILNSTQIVVDGKDATKLPLTEVMSIYLDECVVGWKNVKDSSGNDIKFSKETFELFNDIEIITELFEFCRELVSGNEKN